MEFLLQESSGAVYRAAMMVAHLVCHQQPARSPHIWDIQFPLCWRCSGILAGALTLLIYLVLVKWRFPPFRLSVLLALLLPLDVLIAAIGIWDGDNFSRFVTGVLWGSFGTSAVLRLLQGHAKSYLTKSDQDFSRTYIKTERGCPEKTMIGPLGVSEPRP